MSNGPISAIANRHQHMTLPWVVSSKTSAPNQSLEKTMLSTKKLIKMARRWQKFVAMQKKRIPLPINDSDADSCTTSSSSITGKGHFAVYTTDRKQFVVPLS
ncbi:hypothetical protein HAX54_033505 [Datura stramonium]|uniref:Uncharacterized protein n=1 Tax=Datura stramonium TaxID=4076 RepID=A0ABS8RLL1_DATST|nr:hypothetical protein [Datura stramonium]